MKFIYIRIHIITFSTLLIFLDICNFIYSFDHRVECITVKYDTEVFTSCNINIIGLFDLNYVIYLLNIFEQKIYSKRQNNFLNDIP